MFCPCNVPGQMVLKACSVCRYIAEAPLRADFVFIAFGGMPALLRAALCAAGRDGDEARKQALAQQNVAPS